MKKNMPSFKNRILKKGRSKTEKFRKFKEKLDKFVSTDPLTGVYNFRFFEHHFEKYFENAKLESRPFSLMMVDIDYLKSINDIYGFVMGDKILRQLADLLKTEVRLKDLVIRYGGEEFAVIMPNTNSMGADNIAENILNKVNIETFGDKKTKIKITVSIGLCSCPKEGIVSAKQVITNAEKAMSLSKERGGNDLSVFPYKEDEKEKRELKSEIEEQKKQIKEGSRSKKSLIEFVQALANTVKAKDQYTQEHSKLMSKVAVEIAKQLNLPEIEIERIRLGSVLHDLGKIGISEAILLKPGKLTKEEFELVKQHPQIGAEIVRTVHALRDVIPLILHHHEKYDGSGYLKGLKGEEIPLGARIIGIADVYQALRSDRPYRKAYSKKKALHIIKEGSGKEFDPKIVNIFLKIAKNKYIL